LKLLLYIFFNSVETSKTVGKANENHFRSALFEMTLIICGAIALPFHVYLNYSGIWDVVLANWPYDYGRDSGKNFFSPNGIATLSFMFLVFKQVKSYFMKESVLNYIGEHFSVNRSEKEKKLGKYSSVLMVVVSFAIGFSISVGALSLLIISLSGVVFAEYKVRKRFFSK
jgi:hypothetical protein